MRRISSIFGFAWLRGGEKIKDRKKKQEVAAIAVEQRTLVRHRLTFHRNPLASSAGGRVSWPRLRCLMGSVAIRQQCAADGNVAFSRAERQAHSPFSADAARLRDHSTSRRHRHADPRASAPARPPSTARELGARALRMRGGFCHVWRTAAEMSPSSSTLPRGTPMATIPARIVFSTRHAIGRHVRPHRVPIISSSVLAFSHDPSFSVRPLPSRFLYSSSGQLLSFRRLISRTARNLFPFHLDPILYATVRSQTCTPKLCASLARDSCFMHSHGYGRSVHDAGKIGSRLQ